jgi:hypothetical protein
MTTEYALAVTVHVDADEQPPTMADVIATVHGLLNDDDRNLRPSVQAIGRRHVTRDDNYGERLRSALTDASNTLGDFFDDSERMSEERTKRTRYAALEKLIDDSLRELSRLEDVEARLAAGPDA